MLICKCAETKNNKKTANIETDYHIPNQIEIGWAWTENNHKYCGAAYVSQYTRSEVIEM